MVDQNQFGENKINEKQWNSIFILGGIATIIVLIGSLLDVLIGNVTGGNLSNLPQTAISRFAQFKDNIVLGLYNLDLLNTINQIIFIPSYFALYAAHRKVNKAYAELALIIFIVGTIVFVTNNSALTMLDMSNKYYAATTDDQRILFSAAGEALLIKGAHGSLGVFIGYLLSLIANLLISFVMLKGKIFGKINSYIGIIGSIIMIIYIILVTFVPSVKNIATAVAMPGGLLLMTWMIMYSIKLFKIGNQRIS
jgi:hypothetical protein